MKEVHFLKVHRTASGLTMQELGKIVGVPTSQIQRIEERFASPRINLVYILCEYFKGKSPKTINELKPEDFLF